MRNLSRRYKVAYYHTLVKKKKKKPQEGAKRLLGAAKGPAFKSRVDKRG
jgi:hypothetical protein